MRFTVFLAWGMTASVLLAADSSSIYHSGWIDLNKDG